MAAQATSRNVRKPTIYEALVAKLGRVPTNAELKADVQRIKEEALVEMAGKGRLPHQRGGRGRLRRNPEGQAALEIRDGDVNAVSESASPSVRKIHVWKNYSSKRYVVQVMNDGVYRQSGLPYATRDDVTTFPVWVQRFLSKHNSQIQSVFPPIRRGNPESGSAAMYQSFHGTPSENIEEFEEEEHYHGNLAELGVLLGLKVRTVAGEDVTIKFSEGGADDRSENPGNFRSRKEVEEFAKYLKRAGYNVGKVEGTPASGYGVFKRQAYYSFESDAPGEASAVLKDFLGGKPDKDWLSRQYPEAYSKIAPLFEGTKQNPFWPFNSFTKTTIMHVGTGDKLTAKGQHKGYTVYQDNRSGEWVVPAIERESRFDSKADAHRFVDSWAKADEKLPMSTFCPLI